MDWTFSRPEGLLLFLAVPLVLLLFFHMGRRRRVSVPHLALWLDLTSARARRLARLEDGLWLALLAGCSAALAAAGAGLSLVEDVPVPTSYVFVVDVSPSMLGRDAGGATRLARARARLAVILATLPPGSDVLVLTSSGRVAVPFSTDRALASARVQELDVEAGGPPLDEVLQEAREMVRFRGRGKVACLSDRPPPRDWIPAAGDWLGAGEALDNVGFVDLYVPDLPWWKTAVPLSFGLANFGRAPVRVTPRLQGPLAGRRLAPVTLAPGAVVRQRLIVPRSQREARYELRLPGGDGLALDDALHVVCGPGGPRTLVVVADHEVSPFLASALEAVPDLVRTSEVRVFSPRDYRADQPKAPLTIFYRQPDLPLPVRGGLLSFGPPPAALTASRPVAACAVKRSDPFHPVTAGLSFDGVFFRRAHALERGTPLLATNKGVVAAALEHEGLRAAVLGFALENTNLTVKPDCPLFLRNALRWAGARAEDAGDRHETLAAFAEELKNRGLPCRPGHYAVQDTFHGVNLCDPAESDLRPGKAPPPGRFTPLTDTRSETRPLTHLLSGAGLACLAALLCLAALRRRA